MPTTTIDINKTPIQLAELLSIASAGTEVIIAEGDKTLARLVPVAQPNQRIGNLHPGSIETSDDFDGIRQRVAGLHQGMAWVSDDFDEPLPDEFWMGTS